MDPILGVFEKPLVLVDSNVLYPFVRFVELELNLFSECGHSEDTENENKEYLLRYEYLSGNVFRHYVIVKQWVQKQDHD